MLAFSNNLYYNSILQSQNKEDIDDSSIVYFSKDNYRSFDTKTGFQTNHISNRNSGDWKKSFSSKEIEILNFEFKDFLSNSFRIDTSIVLL